MTMIAADGRLLKWQPGTVDLEATNANNEIPGVTRRLVVPLRQQFVQ
jgi:hypothetical protein